ncbi:MAG: FkbM family methyltransferase [Armatimonadota bacterium]|nr:FkbM family methyltransferase [Armatimonadota bacterium]
MTCQIDFKKKLDEFIDQDMDYIAGRCADLFSKEIGGVADRLILFGAGNLGRKTLAGLRKLGIEPLCFADNNPKSWNTMVDGARVISPTEAAQNYGDNAGFVITVYSPGDDRQLSKIRKSLQDMGCRIVAPFTHLFWEHPELFLPHNWIDLPTNACRSADEIRKIFDLLADDTSRMEFLARLRWIVSSADFELIPNGMEDSTYFPDDLFQLSDHEVFIDCGAYDGDTIQGLLKRVGSAFSKVLALEPDPGNYSLLQAYIGALPDDVRSKISVIPVATGGASGKAGFSALGTVGSQISSIGDIEVDVRTIDSLVGDMRTTYIKMDIEGAELDAIEGARETIKRDLPILAISAYHRQEHLWEVPELIRGISSDYTFYMRRHGDQWGDLVYYAVPPERLIA